MSIRYRLLLIILLIALLPMLVVGYINFTHTRDLLEQQALSGLERQALLKESEVYIYLKEMHTRIIDFSSDGFIRDEIGDPEHKSYSTALSEHLRLNKQPLDPSILSISAYRLNGELVASTSDNQPSITPYLNFFNSVTEWPYSSTLAIKDGVRVLSFFQPIYLRIAGGKRVGYLQMHFNVELLNELTSAQFYQNRHPHGDDEHLKTEDNSTTYLVSQQGYLINDVEGIDAAPSSYKVETLPVLNCIERGKSMTGRWKNHIGEAVLGSSHCINIGDNHWALVTEVNQEEGYRAISSTSYFFIISLIFSIVLIIIAATYISAIIFRPIKLLHRSAVKISEGDWEHRAALKGVGELSDLSHTFDRMVDALRESQNNLESMNKQLLHNNHELLFKQRALDEHTLVLEVDRDGIISYVNNALCQRSQYSEDELIGKSSTLLRAYKHDDGLLGTLWREAKNGKIWHGDMPCRSKSGSIYWVTMTIVPFLDDKNRPERFLSIQTDITHQKMNEEKLSRSNHALTALAAMQGLTGHYHNEALWVQAVADGLSRSNSYDAAWIGIYDPSKKGVISSATFATNKYSETTADLPILADERILDGKLITHQHLEHFSENPLWCQYVDAGYHSLAVLPIVSQQQVLGYLQLASLDPNAFCDEEISLLDKLVFEISSCLLLMRTQSDKERVEHQLSASALNLDQAQEIAQLGSCEWFIKEDYQVWSAQLYRMLGYQPNEVEPLPERLYQAIHVDDRQMVSSTIEQLKKVGGVCNLEYRFVLESGEVRNITTKAKLDTESTTPKIVATMQDVTDRIHMENERKTLELQLKQSQRLQAIGQLTGGIAHDFNNMLAAILGYTDLAKMMILPDQLKISNYLNEIEKAGTRARDLVQQMLIYSRREKSSDAEVLDLKVLVADSLKMMKSTIPPSIIIDHKANNNELPLIEGVPVELHQVVTNLIINARDAIGDKGIIEITLQQVEAEGLLCSSCQRYFSGHYVHVKIKDSGSGIPEQQLFSIFEPFFTTKEVGKGTGMGLSMVHGLVHNHDGHLCVKSQLGDGTSFDLYFPVAAVTQNIEQQTVNKALPPTSTAEIAASTRVMVVDDEASIASMIEIQLKSDGLQPKVFFDSNQALAYFESHSSEIDLLISDQAMPGLLGHEMIAKMRAIKPNLPVVVCTGFSAKEVLALFKQIDGIEVVYKPVDWSLFKRALHRVLQK